MKKFSLFLLAIVLTIVISGCGKTNEKILECNIFSEGNNMNAYGKIKYVFKNDILETGNVEVIFKDITLDNLDYWWDSIKKQFGEQNKPVTIDGYKRSFKSDDKNYSFTVNVEVDYTKISDTTLNEYNIEDYRGKSYDEVKKLSLELEGVTCK